MIAETGSSVIVTNEGNGDLTSTLPRMHIVIASIEKIVPTLEDASTILRLLARSATGQEITTYTTFFTGPRREGDPDGPTAYHVVLLDNGRSEMLGNEFADMLRCIRCGACLNHCPVYGAIGGHAYGSIYPGPMGAVLTPQLDGIDRARDLPNASSFCGRCEAVCPMEIPLPDMMRAWRERDFARGNPPRFERLVLKLWAFAAKRPRLYHALAGRDGAVSRAARGRARTIEPVAADAGLDRGARPPCPARQDLPAASMHARSERMRDERAGGPTVHGPGTHPRRARRGELGPRTQGGGRAAARAPSARHDPRARQGRSGAERVALFTEMLTKQGADVRRVATPKEAVAAIASYLGTCNLPPRIRMGRRSRARRAALARSLGHRALVGPAEPADRAALSRAVVAAAETGTLFLVSGPGQPDHAEFPARGPHRSDRSVGYRRLV